MPTVGAILNKYSQNIYSDNKVTRQKAREKLIDLTNNFTELDLVDEKFLKKYPKWVQLRDQINDAMENANFPYAIKEKVAGEFHKQFEVGDSEKEIEAIRKAETPAYVATMAHHPKTDGANPHASLNRQIQLLQEETFGSDEEKSREASADRLKIVVGINFHHSIHPEKNKPFKAYANNLSDLESNVHATCFSWKPVCVEKKKVVEFSKVKRLFRLIFEIDNDRANEIYKNFTANKAPIPFQMIRETIKNDQITKDCVEKVREDNLDRPTNLYVVDDDAVRYRTGKKGVLSHYDDLIKKNPRLKVASTGYLMKDDDYPVAKIATKADMVGRRALADFFPSASYYPEPNLLVAIPKNKKWFEEISFLRKKNKGNLESLGLLENLGLSKTKAAGELIFWKKGEIETTLPARGKKKTYKATPVKVKKSTLASVRSFPQSSINPREFSINLMKALGIKYKYKTANLIAHIYKVFDPIEYSKTFKNWDELYVSIKNTISDLFEDYVEDVVQTFDEVIEHLPYEFSDGEEEQKFEKLCLEKFNVLRDSRAALLEAGIDQGTFDQIEMCIRSMTNKVNTYLKSALPKEKKK